VVLRCYSSSRPRTTSSGKADTADWSDANAGMSKPAASRGAVCVGHSCLGMTGLKCKTPGAISPFLRHTGQNAPCGYGLSFTGTG